MDSQYTDLLADIRCFGEDSRKHKIIYTPFTLFTLFKFGLGLAPKYKTLV